MNKRFLSLLCCCFTLFVLSVAFPAYAQDITNGLVGHWKFDETSGITASDSSGSNNAGTLTNGPIWMAGKIGGAVSFDGVDDYVDAGSNSVLDNMSAITVSGWFMKTADSNLGTLVRKGGSYNGTGGWSLIDNDNGASSDKAIGFKVGHSTTNLQVTSANGIFTNGIWNHIVVTWDGSTNASNVHIYLNGVDVTSNRTNGSGTRADESAATVRMGDIMDWEIWTVKLLQLGWQKG